MGYRSQVALVFKVADNNKFIGAIFDWDKKHNLKGSYRVKHLLKCADIDKESKDGEHRLISWNDIKWYTGIVGFEDVDFFESLDDYGIKHDFIRIGVEIGDYKMEGELNSGLIYPDQSIWFNNELI